MLKLLCKDQPSSGKCAHFSQVGEGLAAADGRRRRQTPKQEAAQKAKQRKMDHIARRSAKEQHIARLRGWLYALTNSTLDNKWEILKKTMKMNGQLEKSIPVAQFKCPKWTASTTADNWVEVRGHCAPTYLPSGDKNSLYGDNDPCEICIIGSEEEVCIDTSRNAEGFPKNNDWLFNEYGSEIVVRRRPTRRRRQSTRKREKRKPPTTVSETAASKSKVSKGKLATTKEQKEREKRNAKKYNQHMRIQGSNRVVAMIARGATAGEQEHRRAPEGCLVSFMHGYKAIPMSGISSDTDKSTPLIKTTAKKAKGKKEAGSRRLLSRSSSSGKRRRRQSESCGSSNSTKCTYVDTSGKIASCGNFTKGTNSDIKKAKKHCKSCRDTEKAMCGEMTQTMKAAAYVTQRQAKTYANQNWNGTNIKTSMSKLHIEYLKVSICISKAEEVQAKQSLPKELLKLAQETIGKGFVATAKNNVATAKNKKAQKKSDLRQKTKSAAFLGDTAADRRRRKRRRKLQQEREQKEAQQKLEKDVASHIRKYENVSDTTLESYWNSLVANSTHKNSLMYRVRSMLKKFREDNYLVNGTYPNARCVVKKVILTTRIEPVIPIADAPKTEFTEERKLYNLGEESGEGEAEGHISERAPDAASRRLFAAAAAEDRRRKRLTPQQKREQKAKRQKKKTREAKMKTQQSHEAKMKMHTSIDKQAKQSLPKELMKLAQETIGKGFATEAKMLGAMVV